MYVFIHNTSLNECNKSNYLHSHLYECLKTISFIFSDWVEEQFICICFKTLSLDHRVLNIEENVTKDCKKNAENLISPRLLTYLLKISILSFHHQSDQAIDLYSR